MENKTSNTGQTHSQHKDRIVIIPSFCDSRGCLVVCEHEACELPFRPRRTFWITGVPEGQERGGHAHRTCSELVIAANGSVCIDLTDAEGTETYVLDSPDRGLIIPPMCWCRLYNFSKDCVCVCMASEPYDETGYIEHKDEIGL